LQRDWRCSPKISLLPNTPPPPPPPKEEKKPEPPKEQKEVKMEQPDMKQPPAPDNTLKMEGDKGSGPSAFQSGTVTNENRIPASESGNRYAFYSNLMQKFLQDELARNKTLVGKEYRISLNLWFDNSGKIAKFSLTQTSGNPETDTLIRNALGELPPLKTPPPDSMPQPVRLRVTSRGTG
jgi:periplasmic protein TonB